MDITFYILYIPEYPKYPMDMSMGIDFENPMSMDMGMGMTFENEYGCGYSYIRSEPALRPSLSRIEQHIFATTPKNQRTNTYHFPINFF